MIYIKIALKYKKTKQKLKFGLLKFWGFLKPKNLDFMKHFSSPDRWVRAISNLLSEKYPCRKIAQTFILFEMQSSVRYVHAHHLKLDDMIVLGCENSEVQLPNLWTIKTLIWPDAPHRADNLQLVDRVILTAQTTLVEMQAPAIAVAIRAGLLVNIFNLVFRSSFVSFDPTRTRI